MSQGLRHPSLLSSPVPPAWRPSSSSPCRSPSSSCRATSPPNSTPPGTSRLQVARTSSVTSRIGWRGWGSQSSCRTWRPACRTRQAETSVWLRSQFVCYTAARCCCEVNILGTAESSGNARVYILLKQTDCTLFRKFACLWTCNYHIGKCQFQMWQFRGAIYLVPHPWELLIWAHYANLNKIRLMV